MGTYEEGQKVYLPNHLNPPHFPLKEVRDEISKPKFCYSSQHSAKAFADDLSVFSSSLQDHQSLLQTLDNKCSDLDLSLKHEKCISIVFNGHKMDHTTISHSEGAPHATLQMLQQRSLVDWWPSQPAKQRTQPPQN